MTQELPDSDGLVLAQRALETPRMILRPLAQDDLPGYWRAQCDAEVTRYLPYTAWQSMDDGNAWYERMQDRIRRGAITYNTLVCKDTDEVIGGTLFMNAEADVRKLEVGYVMARRFWGQGLMQEALRAELNDAFARWNLRRVEAHIDARNTASRSLAQRMGFQCEAVLREAWCDNQGVVTDATIYGLLRREWEAMSGCR